MTFTEYAGTEILAIEDQLADAYGEVFSRPPFDRPQDSVAHFLERLAADIRRPGFRGVVAGAEGRVDGFATGWITPTPFRTDRAYGTVLQQFGESAVENLLVGALEVDELGVRPSARRSGLARHLLTLLTRHAPNHRAWLLTPTWATDTVAFYNHLGWHPAHPNKPGTVTVFLSPKHPSLHQRPHRTSPR
ncbi:GNAT family N-acetyltransferase [Kribbella sp. NPDC059898]|uniref:GNAT family N-acetyltransferase n=1 Tax=Kribbella sp. NPDC059898 TaxID=3346995 RepID=UPI003647DD1D